MVTSTVMTNYPPQRTARRVTKLTRPPRSPSTTTNAARSTSPTCSVLRPPEPSSSIDPSSSMSRRHHHRVKPKPSHISTSYATRPTRAATHKRPSRSEHIMYRATGSDHGTEAPGQRQRVRGHEQQRDDCEHKGYTPALSEQGNNKMEGKQSRGINLPNLALQFKGWPVLLGLPLRP